MITFFDEPNHALIFKEADTLLRAHKEELCMFGEDCQFAPDWNVYKKMSEHGFLQIVTARDEDGDLVGYCSNVLSRHLHYPFLLAANDVFYLKPGLRGHGVKFIRFVEKELKRRGVQFFTIAIKPHVDFSPVVKRLGYELLEYQYFRRIQ